MPTGLALLGLIQLARRRDPLLLAPLLFAAALLGALLRYSWMLPHYSAVKASYLLPAMLPAAMCLAAGLAHCRGWRRPVLRAGLLGIALGGTLLTWHGWWA